MPLEAPHLNLGLDGKRRNLIHVLAGFTKALAPEAAEIAEERYC